MGSFVVVSDDLVDGVGVVCFFVALGFTFDEDEGYAVDEQDYVGYDVLVALEVELVCDCVRVVFWVVVVDEGDVFPMFVWSQAD